MPQRLRSRVSYANIVSTLALFLALGGVSYAAFRLPPNSVGTRQIKNQAVTLAKINQGAQRALRGQAGAPGARGRQGLQGPQGLQGLQGNPGAAGTARAYGEVSSSGTLGVSKGNPTVTRASTGIYCVAVPGVDGSTTRASVTLQAASTGDAAPPLEKAGTGAQCPSGTFQIYTGTLAPSGGGLVYGNADQPFFFVVP